MSQVYLYNFEGRNSFIAEEAMEKLYENLNLQIDEGEIVGVNYPSLTKGASWFNDFTKISAGFQFGQSLPYILSISNLVQRELSLRVLHPKVFLENSFLWYMRRRIDLEDLKVLFHHPLHNGRGLQREIKVHAGDYGNRTFLRPQNVKPIVDIVKNRGETPGV